MHAPLTPFFEFTTYKNEEKILLIMRLKTYLILHPRNKKAKVKKRPTSSKMVTLIVYFTEGGGGGTTVLFFVFKNKLALF